MTCCQPPKESKKESSSTSITPPTSITSSQSTPQESPMVLPGTPQASSSTLQTPPINMVTVTYRDNQQRGPPFLRSTEAHTWQPSLPAARVRSAPYLGTTGNLRHTPCLALASQMLGYIVVRLITHVPFVPLCFCSPCSLVIILL